MDPSDGWGMSAIPPLSGRSRHRANGPKMTLMTHSRPCQRTISVTVERGRMGSFPSRTPMRRRQFITLLTSVVIHMFCLRSGRTAPGEAFDFISLWTSQARPSSKRHYAKGRSTAWSVA